MVGTVLLLLFAIVLTFFVLPLTVLLATSIIGNGAPFVPVPAKAVPGIVAALKLPPGAIVYDMGCGDGRVLLECVRIQPRIRAIGLERALLPYLLAKIRTRGSGIEVKRQNFFHANLSDATHVVTYLFPEIMERVETKLAAELRPGARIVAVDFPLPKRAPTEVIEQQIPRLRRGTTLYIYV